MAVKTSTLQIAGLVFCTIVAIGVGVGIYFMVSTTPQVDNRLGPYAPGGQSPFVAQRKDNSQYQVIMTTFTTDSTGTKQFNAPYYIMFNPSVSSDPKLTVFGTFSAATAFLNGNWGPAVKDYSNISTSTASTDYTASSIQ